MFPVSYFPASYFAPAYFPPGAVISAVADYGTVVHGRGVSLGQGMTHMDGVGFRHISTPLDPENET